MFSFSLAGILACIVLAALTSHAMAFLPEFLGETFNEGPRVVVTSAAACSYVGPQPYDDQQSDTSSDSAAPNNSSSLTTTSKPDSTHLKVPKASALPGQSGLWQSPSLSLDAVSKCFDDVLPTKPATTPLPVPKTPILTAQTGLWMPSLSLEDDTTPPSSEADPTPSLWVNPYTLPGTFPQNAEAASISFQSTLVVPIGTGTGFIEAEGLAACSGREWPQRDGESAKGTCRVRPKYDLRFRRASLT